MLEFSICDSTHPLLKPFLWVGLPLIYHLLPSLENSVGRHFGDEAQSYLAWDHTGYTNLLS